MVLVDQYGRAESTEVTEFNDVADKCEQLASGLRNFSGVLEKNAYIARIDAAIALIDSIITLKTNLQADKATLQAA